MCLKRPRAVEKQGVGRKNVPSLCFFAEIVVRLSTTSGRRDVE